MIVLTVLDLLLPRLITIPVQKEIDRMKEELEQIADDYERIIRALNK